MARGLLSQLFPETAPVDLRILGRTLWHAALVGAAAGLVGAGFFAGLEYVQHYVLEWLAGYRPLRAVGENFLGQLHGRPFRPWLLVFLPAVGALLSGLLTQFAPECRGGGGDAMIDAYHRADAVIPRRTIWAKTLASIFTLGSGGSGGREGPTMLIGGALGSQVAVVLKLSARERRILLIAGVAAGISAVFRTPLGAALLAAEVLYRDDFESDALIPAVLASVVSYSIVISVYGESTLFGRLASVPFVPSHLPLYGLLAVLLSFVALVFLGFLRLVQHQTARLPVASWARPAVGGLALGTLVTPLIVYMGHRVGEPGQGLGLLGGGYGAAQMAISGSPWLPQGWGAVQLLLLLCFAKLVASSLTIGSGGSAGDFAPSMVIGGLFGGAFGHAVALLLNDPRINPGAFALVGMGTFYGGIAHVPLSALVLTCELAGSYDLLVPLMLCEGIAFVLLRKRTLYHAQVPSKRESPAHLESHAIDVLDHLFVRDVMVHGRPFVSFAPGTAAREVMRQVHDTTWQDVFPVLSPEGVLQGMITSEGLRILAGNEDELQPWTIAADVMQPAVSVRVGEVLRRASRALLDHAVREIPVIDDDGKVVGFLDEAEIARTYLDRTTRANTRGH